ncbi:acyl-CoA:lysophosphatidylglycerol acyltransferase 1 isoform X1 [Tachysurus ichikawai]
MAPLVEKLRRFAWILIKALLRFTFMFINNCVAIPSYCLYLIVLQPLRMVHSSAFWHIEGVMFRWLLAMVASWGWCAGYTGPLFTPASNSLRYVSLHYCLEYPAIPSRVEESVPGAELRSN